MTRLHAAWLLPVLLIASGATRAIRFADEPPSGHERAVGPLPGPEPSISVGVFSLFKPKELYVRAARGGRLHLRIADRTMVVEGASSAHVRLEKGAVTCTVNGQGATGNEVTVEPADAGSGFVLGVPRKIERRFVGNLSIRPAGAVLVAAIVMDLETAVASAVAAESLPGTPIEALKAQAIASRSFYRAHPPGRHATFGFCDTTHCQFLRAPPAPGHPALAAAAATRGIVLAFNGQPIEALFSARCGGRTRSLEELGMKPRLYPYFSVECEWCQKHPAAWERRLDPAATERLQRRRSERARIELVRVLGWQAIPGNEYDVVEHDGKWILRGRGEGHGVGLCQRGAAAMAAAGATFVQILSYYYPNTVLAANTSARSGMPF